jgi:hypothetical protein
MTDVAIDVLQNILDVSDNSICKIFIMQMRIGALSPQFQNASQSMLFRIGTVQIVANGFCDFIAQCILVSINYRAYHDSIIRFIHLNRQRSSVVGSCGVKTSAS